MDYYFWVSTRRIKPDTREQFEQAWRPDEFPDGLVGAYVLYAEGGDDVVGISIWDPAEGGFLAVPFAHRWLRRAKEH